MPFDTKSFSTIEEADAMLRLQVIKDNPELIGNIEEEIRYQYELHEKTASYLNGKFEKLDLSTASLVDKRIMVSHALYTQNFRAIHAAYTLILSGKLSASRIIVRRIHESILEQYYVGLCDESEFSEYFQLSYNPSDGKNKLGHNFYKLALYENGEVMENISKYYSKLSKFTHSTWMTGFDIKYDREHTKGDLSNLRQLSLFNVLSYCQVYTFDKSFLKTFFEFVQSFVSEYLHNSKYTMEQRFPNKKKFIDKIIWHPDNQH